MQKTRGAAILAASALAMSGVAACGGEGEPAESSSTLSPSAVETDSSSGSESPASGSESPSSSSGSSSDGTVAELPTAAKERTKEGAIAFNRFYQRQAGEALKTGRTETLKQLAPDCSVCATYRKRISDRTAKGVAMNKNPNSIGKASATRRSDGAYKVTLTVQAAEYHEVLEDGSQGRTADAVTYTLTTDTQWREGHWVIHDSVIIE